MGDHGRFSGPPDLHGRQLARRWDPEEWELSPPVCGPLPVLFSRSSSPSPVDCREDRRLGRACLTKSRVSLFLCHLHSLGCSYFLMSIKITVRFMALQVLYLLFYTNCIHFYSPESQKSEMDLNGLKSGCQLARLFHDPSKYLPATVLSFLQPQEPDVHHICI